MVDFLIFFHLSFIFQFEKMVFRKQACHGVWCVILVPTVLILAYYKSTSYSKHNLCILMCSFSLSISSLLVYYKVVFPVTVVSGRSCKKVGLFEYILKWLFHDLFERRVSTVVRNTRVSSHAIRAYRKRAIPMATKPRFGTCLLYTSAADDE